MAQLGAQRESDRGKPTLVLDLDGTLIATSRQPGLQFRVDFKVEFDADEQPVWVVKRPGLDEFLSKASQLYEVVIFSLGRGSYVNEMKKKIDPEERWISTWLSRDSCSGSSAIKEYKDLSSPLLGRDLSKVVWVDDFKDSFRMNLENGIVVPMFRNSGAGSDKVLIELWPHLQKLAVAPDVRPALLELELPLLDTNLARPGKLTPGADFHCFKEGIKPEWEDPKCANGGKWTAAPPRLSKPLLDQFWLNTLLALIGEQFTEGDDICGVVVSVRPRGDKLSLWTKTASNEAVQMSIGKQWKEFLEYQDRIGYMFHEDAKRDQKARNRYNV